MLYTNEFSKDLSIVNITEILMHPNEEGVLAFIDEK